MRAIKELKPQSDCELDGVPNFIMEGINSITNLFLLQFLIGCSVMLNSEKWKSCYSKNIFKNI